MAKIIISTEEPLKYYKDFTNSENFKELVDYTREYVISELPRLYGRASEKLRKIENKEEIKEYFEIKEKLKKIKNEKSGAYRKFVKTRDTSYLIKTGEYDLKIRELENRLKNIETTSTFEEYKKIKSEYNRLSLKKRKIENAIDILSKPPYNLKGEKLKERINTLLKVYDDKGQLRIDPLREEFLNAINVSSYFNEILLKVFPELSDYR